MTSYWFDTTNNEIASALLPEEKILPWKVWNINTWVVQSIHPNSYTSIFFISGSFSNHSQNNSFAR